MKTLCVRFIYRNLYLVWGTLVAVVVGLLTGAVLASIVGTMLGIATASFVGKLLS
jgi:tetrahydromethanopterin S-methyltransferase subunit F